MCMLLNLSHCCLSMLFPPIASTVSLSCAGGPLHGCCLAGVKLPRGASLPNGKIVLETSVLPVRAKDHQLHEKNIDVVVSSGPTPQLDHTRTRCCFGLRLLLWYCSLLARSIARRGNRTRQLMAESFIRWADKGATRRRAADAELLDVLAHLRSENAVSTESSEHHHHHHHEPCASITMCFAALYFAN